MCDQSAEQQRDGLSGRQEQAMSTLRCRRGLPYEAKSLPSGEEREYHARVGVPNRKFWLKALSGVGGLQNRSFAHSPPGAMRYNQELWMSS